ncbi:nucleus protein [Pseudozyma hubeiensis SY62]|uniref:Nucleus protein n=1 Tax=Pseudozyma hubeiensis (strain SY62) TaxID=1305764 RepID=R9P0R6_PSEHS|nr:nucleus protein [Pseudozyma hubeiensis SY62]GAC94808.1 nucleus protein [Pseudozyma hubeiensis SY62]
MRGELKAKMPRFQVAFHTANTSVRALTLEIQTPHEHPSYHRNNALKPVLHLLRTIRLCETMSSQTEWPQSLKDFANRAFAACTDVNRKAVSEELRALIFDSFQNGTIHTTDWTNATLKSLGAPSASTKKSLLKKRAAPSSTASASLSASDLEEQQRKEKRARRFEKEQQEFRRQEDEMLETAIASTSLASRFGGGSAGQPSWSAAASAAGTARLNGKSKYGAQTPIGGPHFTDTEVADPNVIDWDEHTVVGTSSKLEKSYLRLTSAPDPKTVRPLSTLVQTLELLKKKWRTENNYSYICDQFKSMRQDLTVQRIKNEFTVKVYEIHARIALEMGDLGEYNQCQSQLRGLYAYGIRGSAMEFLAYRILYLLHTKNRRDVNALMAELTEEHKAEPAVEHALQVRAALVTGNYHSFFQLYTDAPNMNAYIMDHFVERERINALLIMSKCYRPSIALSFIAEELAFQDVAEADEFLSAKGAAAYVEPTPAELAALAPQTNGKKKKSKAIPSLPLEKRQWDAKAAMQPLTDAIQKFRKDNGTADVQLQTSAERIQHFVGKSFSSSNSTERPPYAKTLSTMSWFSSQWNRWSKEANGPSRSGSDGGPIRRIEVVWGRERLQIVLPRTAEPVTLGHLRHEIASITSLPFDKIKLIHRGLVMKDDRLPLTAYGLSEGSRIGLVGSREEGDRPGAKTSVGMGALSVGEQKAREKKAREADTSEQGLMSRITEALETSRKELFPEVEQVETAIAGHLEGKEQTTTEAEAGTTIGGEGKGENKAGGMSYAQIADAHRRLSELLLRQLLALDSVNVNSDTTRQARKIAVKEVQAHLDRLDAAFSKYKSAHK